jgi:hypothetical protein
MAPKPACLAFIILPSPTQMQFKPKNKQKQTITHRYLTCIFMKAIRQLISLQFQVAVRGQAGCQHHTVNILMLRPAFSPSVFGIKPKFLDSFTQTVKRLRYLI